MNRDTLDVRESVTADRAQIESLYPAAFPDEDLLPVVRSLLDDAAVATSFVGVIDSEIVGHVIFTDCGVTGSDVAIAMLAPLAVAPQWQRQGIGSELIRAGMRYLEDTEAVRVCVLGDPAYYKRLGFVPESGILPPYRLPAEWAGAWQSQAVGDRSSSCSGKLAVPPQWQAPALWAP